MSNYYSVYHKETETRVWSTTGGAGFTEGPGDICLTGRRGFQSGGGKSQWLLKACPDSTVNNVSLHKLRANGKNYAKIKTIYTPTGTIVVYGVCWNGAYMLCTTRSSAASATSQIRTIKFPEGTQVATNGIGNSNVWGCCWWRDSLVAITNDGSTIRQYRTYNNGKVWRLVKQYNESPAGSDMRSICHDGRFFYILRESGQIYQYTEHFQQIRFFPGSAGLADHWGICTDGRNLIISKRA